MVTSRDFDVRSLLSLFPGKVHLSYVQVEEFHLKLYPERQTVDVDGQVQAK